MQSLEFPPLLAFAFDRKGGAHRIDPTDAGPHPMAWFHAQWEDPAAAGWLSGNADIPPEVAEALTAAETRPRCTVIRTPAGDGAVINLRGVNLHEGSEPEDMISIRIWLQKDRIISTWRRPLYAVGDLLDGIERGAGPLSPGDFTARLALRLADRAGTDVFRELGVTVTWREL